MGTVCIDAHVGRRLRRKRRMAGLTQHEVAALVGVQPQQIQKYECGANQIYAARLFDLSAALGAPVSYFFEGLADAPTTAPEIGEDLINRHETAALIQSIAALSPRARQALIKLAHDLAEDADGRNTPDSPLEAVNNR